MNLQTISAASRISDASTDLLVAAIKFAESVRSSPELHAEAHNLVKALQSANGIAASVLASARVLSRRADYVRLKAEADEALAEQLEGGEDDED